MVVTPTRFYCDTLASTSITTIFTVPTAHVYTVKQIILCNINPSGGITPAAGSGAFVKVTYYNGSENLDLVSSVKLESENTVILDVNQAFAAGNSLKLTTTVQPLVVTVVGYDNNAQP